MNVNLRPFHQIARRWYPKCAQCGKTVERVVAVPIAPRRECEPMRPVHYAVREYEVHCHGEVERHLLGIWAAGELAQKKQRLPDAFTVRPAPV